MINPQRLSPNSAVSLSFAERFSSFYLVVLGLQSKIVLLCLEFTLKALVSLVSNHSGQLLRKRTL